MKKTCTFFVLFILFVLLCGNEVHAAKEKKIKSIAFKKYEKTLTIEKGQALQLKVKITPKKATNKKLKWKSSKKKVVSVDQKGVIKGKKKGKSTITVQTTDGTGLKLKLKVTVGYKIQSIAFSNVEELAELEVGETCKLRTMIVPSNASNRNLEWTSSNDAIATVDSKGNVTGKSNGVVRISARTTDGTNKKISTTITVVTKMKSVKLSLKAKSAYCTALNQYAVYMKKGAKCSIETEIKPVTTTNKALVWSSSNPKVATVSYDGKVQAVGIGVTFITAQSTDGSEKKDTFTIYVSRLKKEDCKYVSHRGLCEKAPDNSRSAIELALKSGFDAVEFDVWKTIDNQFAVTHDESLLETCGVDVKVTELTLPQAMSYRIITGNNIDTYTQEYIPSLEQILMLAKSYPEKELYIELKQPISQEVLQSLVDMLTIYEVKDRVTIISFYKENIKILKTMTDEEGAVLSMQFLINEPNDEAVQFCLDNQVDMSVKYNCINEEQVEQLHENELKLNMWGIPNFLTAHHMIHTMKVDMVTLDHKFFE